MSSLRRSARIAAKNPPSTPIKVRSTRMIPAAPNKVFLRHTRSMGPVPPAARILSFQEFYHSPVMVAARAAAAARHPAFSTEYYNELELCPALQEWRSAYWDSLPPLSSGL